MEVSVCRIMGSRATKGLSKKFGWRSFSPETKRREGRGAPYGRSSLLCAPPARMKQIESVDAEES